MSRAIGRLVMYERPRSPRSDAAGVVRELHGERLVEPQLAPQPRDGRRVGALADHLLHRVAGRDVEQQEGDDQHAEQRRDGEQRGGGARNVSASVAAGPHCVRGPALICHVRPALAVEDRRRPEPLDPRLHGVQLVVEEQEDHRRVARRRARRPARYSARALRVVLLAARERDEAVERRRSRRTRRCRRRPCSRCGAAGTGSSRRRGSRRTSPSRTGPSARCARPRAPRRSRAARASRGCPAARGSPGCVSAMRAKVGVLRGPELDVDAVRVAGRGEQLLRLRDVVRVARARRVGARQRRRDDAGGEAPAAGDAAGRGSLRVDGVVDRLAHAHVLERPARRVDRDVEQDRARARSAGARSCSSVCSQVARLALRHLRGRRRCRSRTRRPPCSAPG